MSPAVKSKTPSLVPWSVCVVTIASLNPQSTPVKRDRAVHELTPNTSGPLGLMNMIVSV